MKSLEDKDYLEPETEEKWKPLKELKKRGCGQKNETGNNFAGNSLNRLGQEERRSREAGEERITETKIRGDMVIEQAFSNKKEESDGYSFFHWQILNLLFIQYFSEASSVVGTLVKERPQMY